MTTFHSLTVAKVEPETRDAVTITFAEIGRAHV